MGIGYALYEHLTWTIAGAAASTASRTTTSSTRPTCPTSRCSWSSTRATTGRSAPRASVDRHGPHGAGDRQRGEQRAGDGALELPLTPERIVAALHEEEVRMQLLLTVNGMGYEVEARPTARLLDVLRDQLGPRAPRRVRRGRVRGVHRHRRRQGRELVRDARRAGARQGDPDGRGPRAGRRARPPAAEVRRVRRRPVRLLHPRHAHVGQGAAHGQPRAVGAGHPHRARRQPLPLYRLLGDRRRGQGGERPEATRRWSCRPSAAELAARSPPTRRRWPRPARSWRPRPARRPAGRALRAASLLGDPRPPVRTGVSDVAQDRGRHRPRWTGSWRRWRRPRRDAAAGRRHRPGAGPAPAGRGAGRPHRPVGARRAEGRPPRRRDAARRRARDLPRSCSGTHWCASTPTA